VVERFSVSLEHELLERFDKLIEVQKYDNRSEAIRDLIRDDLNKRDWEEDGDVIGVVSFVYDHHQPNLQSRLTSLQHDHHEHILSTTHVHVNHDDCLEVVIVSGRAHEVRDLHRSLASLRGVRNCYLSTTGSGGKEHHNAHE
jgi:CopG family nickel-responsive transcriptional regulator